MRSRTVRSRDIPERVLPAVALAVLVAGCGGGFNQQSGSATTSSAPATSSAGGTPGTTSSSSRPHDGDDHSEPPFPADTRPDTGQASAGARGTITDVRVGHHDGFDRVVFEVAGTGTPGWDVRYVDEAVEQGRGEHIPVAGNAILQVTITGVGYPTETGIDEYDGTQPLPGHGTDVVTEVVWDSTFEGSSVAFVGTTAQLPFRVYLLQGPARVVLEVVHDDGGDDDDTDHD
jgi:hypothetical protein